MVSQKSYGTVKPQLIPGEAIVPQKVCKTVDRDCPKFMIIKPSILPYISSSSYYNLMKGHPITVIVIKVNT